MNEPNPELARSRFNERYKAVVSSAFDRIFASDSAIVADVTTSHSWAKDDFFLVAVRLDEGDPLAMVFRVGAAVEGMYETRTYFYHQHLGSLQVRDAFLTPDDITALSLDMPAWSDHEADDMTDGFIQQQHVATESDYFDFLTDLNGYTPNNQS